MRAHALAVLATTLCTCVHARECGLKEIKEKNIQGCVKIKYTKFMGVKGAIWLAHALHRHPHLRVLDLHSTRFGDEDAIAFADALRNNTHLKRLHLHNNRIYDTGAIALGKALLENDCLEFLSLSSNGVGNEGAKGLAEGLRGNSVLRRLDLYFNLISDDGAAALADALKVNRGLRILHLDTNHIDEAGGLALAKAIDGGRSGLLGGGSPSISLGELTISYNPIGPVAVDALIAAAERNPVIHNLAMDQIPGIKGATKTSLVEVHQPRMDERHQVAKFLVHNELIEEAGHHHDHKDMGHNKKWHGGWHSAKGPPLASDLAPAVQQLHAHTKEGLRALRSKSKEELSAHPALASLPADRRDALVTVLLARAREAVEKDEI